MATESLPEEGELRLGELDHLDAAEAFWWG
jgi:hypothetical protein